MPHHLQSDVVPLAALLLNDYVHHHRIGPQRRMQPDRAPMIRDALVECIWYAGAAVPVVDTHCD